MRRSKKKKKANHVRHSVRFAYGSYSNWPVGVTLEKHQNLRANVDRLWFAGEATSAQFFGFLQGAWFEGQEIGRRVASILGGDVFGDDAGPMQNYDVLHGTTFEDEYNEDNGWDYDSFEISLQPDEA
jgi:polyamine oxidase